MFIKRRELMSYTNKKIICPKCKKVYFDLGVRYIKTICDCGQKLDSSMEVEDNRKEIKNINREEE
jgi:hypothetical protein